MAQATETRSQSIRLTDNALNHLLQLRQQQSADLCLRVGVRGGGCSGMSYTMDFADPNTIRPEDDISEYAGFKIACDPKSMIYLYGLVLDYSSAMIGGGFQFTNPNANQTCGCGKSFGV